MTNRITASAEGLMEQASMTAHTYFHAAIKSIDERFGEGYAEAHPELIGAFMRTAAQDFHTAISTQAIQDGVDQISESLRSTIP